MVIEFYNHKRKSSMASNFSKPLPKGTFNNTKPCKNHPGQSFTSSVLHQMDNISKLRSTMVSSGNLDPSRINNLSALMDLNKKN